MLIFSSFNEHVRFIIQEKSFIDNEEMRGYHCAYADQDYIVCCLENVHGENFIQKQIYVVVW